MNTERRSLYDSLDWHRLLLEFRSELISVIEGIRPGACIYVRKRWMGHDFVLLQEKSLLNCIEAAGLFFRKSGVCGGFYVAREESLLNSLRSGNVSIGEFLGYPKCCEDAFYKGIKEDNVGYAVLHCREIQNVWKNGGDIEPGLRFIYHVPCCLECKESAEFGLKNMVVLIKNDPEAANWTSEYLDQSVYSFHYYHGDEK